MAHEIDDDDDIHFFQHVFNLLDIVVAYGEGRVSVQDFLNVCRTYQGDAPHFLLSEYEAYVAPENDEDNDNVDDPRALFYDISGTPGPVFFHCLLVLSEDQLVALLEAVTAESPNVHSLTHERHSLLHLALNHSMSVRVQLLLAVPEATRALDECLQTPLHMACLLHRVDPQVIHQLIDLDSDTLTLRDDEGQVPLHSALGRDPSSTYVRRMIELRPETIYVRDDQGQTPVTGAMCVSFDGASPEMVEAFRRIVVRHPKAAELPDPELHDFTPLQYLCGHRAHSRFPELIPAFLEADPASLVVPGRTSRPSAEWVKCLPFEEAALFHSGDDELVALLRDETIHMALAVVEYVLGVTTDSPVAGESDSADSNVAWFQGHIKDTLRELFPEVPLDGATGLSVAQALLRRIDGDHSNSNNGSGSTVVALTRALFLHDRAFELLRGESRQLRFVALCDTVVDLYRLNRQGRYYRPTLSDSRSHDTKVDEGAAPAPLHQIQLLASMRDSTSVESTYLQFREVSHHVLLVHGRRGGGGGRTSTGPPPSKASPTAAPGTMPSPPHPTATNRKRDSSGKSLETDSSASSKCTPHAYS